MTNGFEFESEQEVLDAVTDYIDAVEQSEWQQAVVCAEKLEQKDCGICTQFGKHLLSIAAGCGTAVRDEARASLADVALEEASYIRDVVVSSEMK